MMRMKVRDRFLSHLRLKVSIIRVALVSKIRDSIMIFVEKIVRGYENIRLIMKRNLTTYTVWFAAGRCCITIDSVRFEPYV